LDTLSINIAIIKKGRTKLVSFSNPIRVAKTRLDKESRYSTTRQSIRVFSTQESGTIVSEDKDAIILLKDNTNIKEITDKEITEAPTNRLLPKKRKYP
jgi:hypothetical protein